MKKRGRNPSERSDYDDVRVSVGKFTYAETSLMKTSETEELSPKGGCQAEIYSWIEAE